MRLFPSFSERKVGLRIGLLFRGGSFIRKSGTDFRNTVVFGKCKLELRSITVGSKSMSPSLLHRPASSSTARVNTGIVGVAFAFVFTVDTLFVLHAGFAE